MKSLLLSLILLITASFSTSCQIQEDAGITKRDKMFEIASSDTYAQYRTNIIDRALMVATKAFDGDAIDKLLKDNPQKLNIIDFKEDDFETIYGGNQYYKNSLDRELLLQQLDTQFKYLSFSIDESQEIYGMYKLIKNTAEEENLKEIVFKKLQKTLK